MLLEEVDDLWDAITSNDLASARKEAVQVAAVALRYIAELPGTRELTRGTSHEPGASR